MKTYMNQQDFIFRAVSQDMRQKASPQDVVDSVTEIKKSFETLSHATRVNLLIEYITEKSELEQVKKEALNRTDSESAAEAQAIAEIQNWVEENIDQTKFPQNSVSHAIDIIKTRVKTDIRSR